MFLFVVFVSLLLYQRTVTIQNRISILGSNHKSLSRPQRILHTAMKLASTFYSSGAFLFNLSQLLLANAHTIDASSKDTNPFTFFQLKRMELSLQF